MRKINKFFAVVALLLVSTMAFAQKITVKGVVFEAGGDVLAGVTVLDKGNTANYAMTDAKGGFSINVPTNGTLVISCLGYQTVEVAVNGQAKQTISLKPDSQELDDVIVVAYGTQKKSSFVGAATQLNEDKLKTMQTSNIAKSLEGSIAGVQVSSSSGTPGSGADIRIRGIGSINASQSPLIVVDGTPYEGSLNSIPNQDIESLTVLKDAAANSLYGARGSNGVILITTKRGKSGKFSMSFDAKWGANDLGVPFYETITNPADYYEMSWEAIRNSLYYTGTKDLAQAGIIASSYMTENGLYNIYKGIEDHKIVDPSTGKINPNATEYKWNDNWRDVFRPGFRQEYNFNAAGGSEKTQGYMSLSYLDDGGYVINSGFKRFTVRGKVDHQFTKWLEAGVNISYSNTNQRVYNDSEGSNYSNLFFSVQATPCIYPVYLYDKTTGELQRDAQGNALYDWGENGRPFANGSNAYGQLMTSKYDVKRDNITSRGYLKFNILKNLFITANVAYDAFITKSDSYVTPLGGDAANVNGRGEQQMSRYGALNTNQLINWIPTIGKNTFNILIGHEIKKDNSYSLYGHMTNFVNTSVSDFANATQYVGLTSASTEYFLQGFFGKAEWNYDGRYYLSASYRRDGSSRFSEAKRWGDFWSVGGAWNLGNEKFVKNASWLDVLKIKASYGTQGNDNIGYTNVSDNLYSIERVDGQASLSKVFRSAENLTWEKSNNLNVGIEAVLWNRLSLNVDYFLKQTKDMIYARPLAPSQGLPSSQRVNDMDMENSGIEFDINVNIFRTKNFTWDININGTHYKNKITRLPSDYPAWGKQVGSAWREIGQPLYNYYLKEYAGVDPTNGQPLYNVYETDAETGLAVGEPIGTVNNPTNATYVKTGKSAIPDLYGGFGTTLQAYGVDVNLSFAYQIGGYTYDSVYASLMGAGANSDNWHKDIYNRWTPQNTNTTVPRVQYNSQNANAQSTRFLTSSSYISLRNLTVGYTLPKKWTDAIKLSAIRIYFQGDNVFYLSSRKGMDVRKSFSGATGNTYSAIRTLSGGLSITF